MPINEMDSLKNKIEKLTKELAEKDTNLILAAQYGKDLLIQNAELHTEIEKITQEYDKKIENFQQEKYSLTMTLAAKERVIGSLNTEIESQDKNHKESLKKESAVLQDEILKLQKLLATSESTIELLHREIAIQSEKCNSLQSLLEQSQQNQLDSAHNLTENGCDDHIIQLEAQLVTLTTEKQEFEKRLLEASSAAKTAKLAVQQKETEVTRLSTEIEEKESQLTSLFNLVERTKEEAECLRVEIDQMKFAETDTKKKGNSLFGELEDNRQALEKNVISLSSKVSSLKKQNDLKAQQVAKLKLQIASLLSMTTNSGDLQYQKDLLESLEMAKSEMASLASKYQALEQELHEKSKLSKFDSNSEVDSSTSRGGENILKYLYDESRNKVASLEEELKTTCFAKISLNDQVLQLKRKLHLSEMERKSTEAELIRLTVKLEDLAGSRPEDAQDQKIKPKNVKPQMFIERLPETSENKVEQNGTAVLETANKQCLREILIPAQSKDSKNTPKDVQKETVVVQTPLENKENEFPSNKDSGERPKSQIKRVGFACEEQAECVKTEQNMKGLETKPRRKMEAPTIKVEACTDSKEDCKVQ